MGFPGDSVGKESACNAGDPGSIPGPGEGNDNPLQYSCLENSIDRRSLVGYSLWGSKYSDLTEPLTLSLSLHIVNEIVYLLLLLICFFPSFLKKF